MVKIKICGLKEKEDVIFLNKFPVDYVGFILYSKSPRYVGDALKELLPFVEKAKKVAVFVNPEYKKVREILDYGIDLIQLHGEETLEFVKKIGFEKVIKAFRVGDNFDLKVLKPWEKCYAILLDTYVKEIPGGTGRVFNWDIAKEAVSLGYRVFLAGGLNLENVSDAIKKVKPFAIDIASGVELYPGKKDPEKIRKLFDKLKVTSC